jgi:monoamine oxidase
VLVLEAADRVDGRAMSETTALGSRLDVGGQWIGHDHNRVTAFGGRARRHHVPMHTGRMPAVVDGPRRVSPVAPPMLLAAVALADVGELFRLDAPARWNDASLEASLDIGLARRRLCREEDRNGNWRPKLAEQALAYRGLRGPTG